MKTRRLNSYELLCLGWICQVFQGCLVSHRNNRSHGIAFETLMITIQDFLTDPETDLRLMFTEIGRLRTIEGRDGQYQIGFILGSALVSIPRLLCELFDFSEDYCNLDQDEFLKGLTIGMCNGVSKFEYMTDSSVLASDLGIHFADACSVSTNPDLTGNQDAAICEYLANSRKRGKKSFFISFLDGMIAKYRGMKDAQKMHLTTGIGGVMLKELFYKFRKLTPNQVLLLVR